MTTAISSIERPLNEPVLSYAPGTPERAEIKRELGRVANEQRVLPSIIDGAPVMGGTRVPVTMPHRHRHVLGTIHQGDRAEVESAIAAAQRARHDWAAMSFDARAAIFLKAADLLAGRHRARVNAATMLGQSKTVHQAEIDAACELVDFWRFNVYFARRLLEEQPLSPRGQWNRLDWRPLDGFVAAITPFNFTSIAGNLPTAPALMGNTVVWKSATTSALSAQALMDVLTEAGLPAGVVNLVHAPGPVFGDVVFKHRDFAGLHFTGSTGTFNSIWQTVGQNLAAYRAYPRLVGETGGKDFVVAHPSADVEALAVALVRGAFEYQGQKCSAASRAYIPQSMWPRLAPRLEAELAALKMGDVTDFTNFVGAVIDERSFRKIRSYIELGKSGGGGTGIFHGGACDDREGWFVQPTVVLTDDPRHRLMTEEIFGPVLTIHRYDDAKFDQALALIDEATPYALTGAVFAQDRSAVEHVLERLRFAAGNFYINDKPTGAVVGQQPFGGSRASGTNDKAGSVLNLVRWTSPRAIKETFDPPRAVAYPFMQAGE